MRDFLTASENIASAAHYGMVNSGHPTYEHLQAVVAMLRHYVPTASDELVAAAWLHDTLKYTTTTTHEIRLITTPRVAKICEVVTDPGNRIIDKASPREPRGVVKQRLYENFRAQTDHSVIRDSAIIRLVDRAENQRLAILEKNMVRMQNYVSEFEEYMDVYDCDAIRDGLYELNPIIDLLWEQFQQMRSMGVIPNYEIPVALDEKAAKVVLQRG